MTTLSHQIQRFLLHKELAENKSKITLANYRGYLDRFCDFCGDLPVEKISSDEIFRFQLYVSERRGKDGQSIKDKSRREYFVALRSFFKFLNEQDEWMEYLEDPI